MVRKAASALLLGLLLSGCGGGFVVSFGDDGFAFNDRALFRMGIRGQGAAQDFRIQTNTLEVTRLGRAEMRLPIDQRRLVPQGRVVRGDGGYNAPWSWHLEDVRFTEVPQAICDGLPRDLEANVADWVDRRISFCPSGAYVADEL